MSARKEEMMMDESISQLTSKMPTPPPRPASLASSTRSSKRSSAASVMTNPNTKHFEGDAPPTPSIAEYYTNGAAIIPSIPSPIISQRPSSSFMSLGDELALANQQEIAASTRSSMASTSANVIPRDYAIHQQQQTERVNHSNKSSRPSAITRASTSSSISNGSSGVKRKPSKQTQRASEGPTIVIGVRPSGATSSSDYSSYRSSRTHSSNSEHQKPQRPPRSHRNSDNGRRERQGAISPSIDPSVKKSGRLKNTMQTSVSFVSELSKAFYMLWSQVLYPLLIAILGSLNLTRSTEKHARGEFQSVPEKKQDNNKQSSDQSFAEKFKFALCTSNLLTTSLAISSYDSPVPETKKDESEAEGEELPTPTSIIDFRQIKGVLSEGDLDPLAVASSNSSQIQMSKGAQTLLKGCALAVVFLIPFSASKDVWMRSTLLLTSVMWGIVAVFGVRTLTSITYELSHTPTGSYRPSLYDSNASEDNSGERLTDQRRKQIREGMQNRVVKLIKACKSFDIECNKALAAIQETELISRGYKISHPLPPISRIELSNTKAPSSPPRIRNGSLNGLPLGSRASFNARHLNANGYGQTSNLPTAESTSLEPVRMARLRKSLANAFEDVNGTMKDATLALKPLGDQTEMNLLREMYDLDANINRRSGSFLAETNDSTIQRTSWNSRGITPSDLTRPSSSLTNDDQQSSPRTPQNRDSLLDNSLLDRSSSLRKRESGGGLWDTPSSMSGSVANSMAGVRPGSRLSYISDKSPTTVTSFTGPNQNGALKRLSYSSNGSLSGGVSTGVNGSSPFRTALQPTTRTGSGHNKRQGSVQLALHGLSDDARSPSPFPLSATLHAPVSPNMITSVDGHKIISLKESFEQMHTIRKRALCSLLALDFSLNDVVQIEASTIKSTRRYWSQVGRILNGLSDCLTGLSESVKADLQKEISISKDHGQKAEDVLSDAPKRDSSGHLIDYSGFQDRLIAMGDSLRSVQIKMRLCADDLQMRGSAPLHGDLSEENSSTTSGSEKRASSSTEMMFGTIREDLLQLSAEWEAASKIMRVHGLTQTDNAVNTSVDSTGGSSTTSSITNTGNSSNTTAGTLLLESPQEAEEDAMREWIKNQKAHLANDVSLETTAIEAGIKHMLEQGSKTREQGANKEDELSSLLLRSTSPQHLPPPGVETVYEDVALPAAKKQPSNLSREERIRLMKEQRNSDAQQLAMHAKQRTSGGAEMTNGMMSELRSVMKIRRSAIIDGKLQQRSDIGSHGEDELSSSERSNSPATPIMQSSYSADTPSLRAESAKSHLMQSSQGSHLQRRSARSGSSGRPSLSLSSPVSEYQQGGFAYGSQRQ
ncbi:uncharacterized protein FA14DRAFT_83289 [Meira miltonrushii]|uniref:Myosin-binding domain-containing protein n=1 Tax=Meira miltonrushii TaxID=1280837 RepID=A0A316V324_9BASI|nr:uncharacterized protein FA14DRAFT_83289 [Meira miltonrushii]PWN31956.1 hypothetical protein FA14DRAFT_83289 [Meira miltonrushii]